MSRRSDVIKKICYIHNKEFYHSWEIPGVLWALFRNWWQRPNVYFHLKKDFIWNAEWQRDRDIEKNVFNLLANSLINHKCWSWGRPKPGALISTWITHVGSKGPDTYLLTTIYPGTIRVGSTGSGAAWPWISPVLQHANRSTQQANSLWHNSIPMSSFLIGDWAPWL